MSAPEKTFWSSKIQWAEAKEAAAGLREARRVLSDTQKQLAQAERKRSGLAQPTFAQVWWASSLTPGSAPRAQEFRHPENGYFEETGNLLTEIGCQRFIIGGISLSDIVDSGQARFIGNALSHLDPLETNLPLEAAIDPKNRFFDFLDSGKNLSPYWLRQLTDVHRKTTAAIEGGELYRLGDASLLETVQLAVAFQREVGRPLLGHNEATITSTQVGLPLRRKTLCLGGTEDPQVLRITAVPNKWLARSLGNLQVALSH